MPLFNTATSFDADIERVTSELNTSEDWNMILDICDRAKQSTPAAKDCIRSIVKRLNNRVPYVAIQALSLLNACVRNCGHLFHLEIASRDFINECKSLISEKSHPKVAQNLKMLIKQWAEGEFKNDASLSLIPAFYHNLKADGHSFVSDEPPPKAPVVLSKDPNVVNSQEEQDDIAKAIALSLKDAESKKTTKSSSGYSSSSSSTQQSSTLYPGISTGGGGYNTSLKTSLREPRKVRALYDFEAVEDNELTFKSGEVIGVLDDSDPNWWKGVSWRGEGLFPANFVTNELDIPDTATEKTVEVVETPVPEQLPAITVDEEVIDRTLIMIQNADPTGETCPDPPELSQLEDQCKSMTPLINQELEQVDRQHGRLMEINTELMTAMQMYNDLMRELPTYGYSLGGATMLPPHPGSSGLPGGPPSYSSLTQMISNQPGLSLGQIPQGIAAQVGQNPAPGLPNLSPSHQPSHLQQQQTMHVPPQIQQYGPTPQQYYDPNQQYAPQNSQGAMSYAGQPNNYGTPGNIPPQQQQQQQLLQQQQQQPMYATQQRL